MKQLLIASLFFLSNIVLAQLSVNTNVTDSAMANSIAGNGVSISNVTMNCSNYAYGTFDGTSSNVGIDGGVILTTGFADSPPVTACSYTLELSDAGSNGWNCGAVNAYVNGQLVGSYSENSQWGMTSVNIIVETGDNLTLEYVSAGGAGCDESEHSLTLYDPNYMTITTQSAPLTPGNIYTGVADCAGNSLFDSYSAVGPNNENMASYGHGLTYSDPDLTQLVPDATYDVCIMEFDLVPSCSLLEINYVFASEEYPDFVCSDKNDIFGFFISGPGIAGPFSNGGENMAVVPGTNQYVGINTINGGTPGTSATGNCSSNGESLANTALFNITGNGSMNCPGSPFCNDNTSIRYNGYTDPLIASANVIACETYHMKIIIADAGDSGYDSGVFLTYQGLTCPNTDIVANEIQSQIVEGCQDGEFEIIKNTNVNDDLTVNIYSANSSSATDNVDYSVVDSVLIPGGTSTATVNIAGITDGITETTETIDLLVEWFVCNVPYYDTLHFTIADGPYLGFNVTNENCNTCDGSATVSMVGGVAGYTYNWDANANNQITPTASNLCSGTYFVQVTDGNNCLASDSVTITSSGSAMVSDTVTICNGDSVLIHGIYQNTAGIYYDTLTTSLNCDSIIETTLAIQPDFLIIVDDTICNGDSLFLAGQYQYNTGVYYDSLQTVLGCDSIIETRLEVNPVDDATILPIGTLCESSSPVNLSSVTPGGTWSGTGIIDTLTGTFNPSVAGSGNWLITYNTNSGCSNQDTIIITVNQQQDAGIQAIGPLCVEQSPINLSANNPGGIWSGTGITNSTTGEFTPSVVGTGTYVVNYALNGLCGDTGTFNVVVNDTLDVDLLGATSICPNTSTIISADAIGGDGNYTYSWSHGLGNNQNADVSPSTTTTYSISVTDNCGSTPASDFVTISIQSIPVFDFNASVNEGCSPLSVQFNSTNIPANITSYSWNFGNSLSSTDSTTNTTYQNPGCYPVSLSVTTTSGCIGTITKPNYVCVHTDPEANFVYAPTEITTLNPSTTFTSTSNNANTFLWDFGAFASPGTSTNTNETVEFSNQSGGEYLVCLSVESTNGCTDQECKMVSVEHVPVLYVPNSFTPNNDHLNDIFKPSLSGYDRGEYRLLIFNRWGEKVFETTDIDSGWNGYYKSKMAPQGIYVWKIVISGMGDDSNNTYTGHVNLLK